MPKSWAIRIVAVLLVLAVTGMAVRSVGAQDAVWNLRTPEWAAAWAMLPAGGNPDLELIAIASQLAAYSGSFLPVAPVAPGLTAGLEPGHVPVDLAWFSAPPGILAFGLADGWAHLMLGHTTLAETGSSTDAAAWAAGVRYGREDAAAADAWAARFLAEFGHPVEPLLAAFCQRGEGARAEAVADAYEAVVGWRPEAACAAVAVEAEPEPPALDCDGAFAACRSAVDAAALVCGDGCYGGQCALVCSSGSYEQCSSCTSSCNRACNSAAVEAWEGCEAERDLCRAPD